MLTSAIVFVLFLGPLVFFHELGHFLFARLFGVRVEVFSIGFGKKIFKKKWGDTEYAISIIPLGGYVKMFGDDPLNKDAVEESERQFAFTHKSKWARFWIVFGGPLANFIMAFVIYFLLLMGGEKVPEPRIGIIPQNSDYYSKGLRSADVLKRINDFPIMSFDDLNMIDSVVDSVTVTRGNEEVTVSINEKAEPFIKTLMSFPPSYRSPIFRDNNNKWFILSSTQGKIDWHTSIEEIEAASLKSYYLYPIDLENKVDGHFAVDYTNEQKLNFIGYPSEQMLKKGYYANDMIISSVIVGSPADNAKLLKDDVIISIDNKPVYKFHDLREHIQNTKEGQAVTVGLMRAGKKVKASITPIVKEIEKTKMKSIGVYSGAIAARPRMIVSPSKGFIDSIIIGYDRTIEAMYKTMLGFKKLIVGDASVKNIGGPFAIAKFASDSLSISLSFFFRQMAIISINLGIINLFPIPILDGGHIMILFFELVNRGPISRRKLEVAQQIGLSLLLILMFVAIFNDFTRFFS
jgi:regulator of sigma E protease